MANGDSKTPMMPIPQDLTKNTASGDADFVAQVAHSEASVGTPHPSYTDMQHQQGAGPNTHPSYDSYKHEGRQ